MSSFLHCCRLLSCMIVLAVTMAGRAYGTDLYVAVAANFTGTMQQLLPAFEKAQGVHVVASYGSTGKLTAQILNGAPYEVFLSADTQHPQDLIKQGAAVTNTNFVYASGQLVLWSAQPHLIDAEGEVLRQDKFQHLAIANPDTAPYGAAAVATLRHLQLLPALQSRLVQGESVAQTQQFIASGNAELGFVAFSQILGLSKEIAGSYWLVPKQLYPTIAQAAVLLNKGRSDANAKAFLLYLRSPQAQQVIMRNGYAIDSTQP